MIHKHINKKIRIWKFFSVHEHLMYRNAVYNQQNN